MQMRARSERYSAQELDRVGPVYLNSWSRPSGAGIKSVGGGAALTAIAALPSLA